MAKQGPDTGAEIRHSTELHFGYLTDVTYGKVFYNCFQQLVHPPNKGLCYVSTTHAHWQSRL